MIDSFWKNKKVLITGHTGFKGSWLSLWLQQMKAEVIGVSLEPPTTPNLYNIARVDEGIVSLRQDIRDNKAVQQIFQEHQPEFVFHLAAQPLVRYSYQEPVETYETNVMGTLHVLEGVRSVDSVRAVVVVTTDKCYENLEWDWGYREIDSMGGHDPYSSSKGSVELLVASYRNSFFSGDKSHIPMIATARAGNVIGGGDWAQDRLIPDVVRSFKKGQAVHIRNPHSIRPWQHVLEPLYGYLMLAERLDVQGELFADAWNFGPLDDDVREVQWIVERMAEIWGQGSHWIVDDGEHPHEANYLKLDCSKAHNRLFWRPKWRLQDALEKVVEWHRSEQKGEDMKTVCLAQISEYLG